MRAVSLGSALVRATRALPHVQYGGKIGRSPARLTLAACERRPGTQLTLANLSGTGWATGAA